MSGGEWSRREVEAIIDAGFPYIAGYKPRFNYQSLLAEALGEKLADAAQLQQVAEADADSPIVVPEVDDILAVLSNPPSRPREPDRIAETRRIPIRLATNYIEREARNRSLGAAGELFALNYERARLIHDGQERLAARIEHTSKVRGDFAGYDILSFDVSGAERLIEVKTTKYGAETPFLSRAMKSPPPSVKRVSITSTGCTASDTHRNSSRYPAPSARVASSRPPHFWHCPGNRRNLARGAVA